MKLHQPIILSAIVMFFISITNQLNAQKLAVMPYVSGMNSPIDVKNCGDERLFVAERGGDIKIINADGTLRATPFLDISSKIYQGTNEQGLLGIAFSPNYKTDRKFYVYYTAYVSAMVTVVLEEYKVSALDSDIADPASSITLLTQSTPTDDDLGGNIMFGRDGYLYVNIGDGGSGDYGQRTNTFLGKILRIDINNSSIAQPYAIPPSNPFFSDNTSGIKKEIWAYGVRNPWRSSIDRLTGDLLIADVGLYKVEEVDFQNANDVGGTNYGWYIAEGDSCFVTPNCDKTGITLPIYEYFHNGGPAAVVGGYVVRTTQSKALWGQYIFADFISKWIHGFFLSNGTVSGNINEFITPAQSTGNPISFGEDSYGDQYILFNNNGTVYKLEDTSYLRNPKSYITSVEENGGASYLLQGLKGRNLTYQWLRNNVPISGASMPDYDVNSTGNYSLVVTNNLGFSDTSDIFPFGALPLNFLSFTAQEAEPGKVNLQWKTSSEQNIKGYNILRKQGAEMDFSNIGFVQSKSFSGNSNSELDYSSVDTSVLSNSKIFYRLQIENKDGGNTYSNIISIASSNGKNIFSIYPNPAKRQFTVYINKFTQPVMMNIYDNNGQKIKEQILNQQKSTIKILGIKGIYIIQLSSMDGSSLEREKLLIE